ncbi:hypothetical protein HUU62_15835 [Rhodoferax sp. 4810]|uniref:Uncharacterized protein n=1 Tax=Thiospirillum jenense TaxID=1653858 RepID=A0A839HJD5_9GAMM|nr:hypothetical protein [Thiospirillum jenense]MBB1075874.1 hypothetical protein [Rhodoferax jenense]MBB1126102.1 hypothetical protein [Thiospirillum jenense]
MYQDVNDLDSRSRLLIGLGLAAAIAATRGQYFAPLAHHLPDATLAAFFLGGVYLQQRRGFVALCVLTTVLDLIAMTWGGVSSHCFTFAYWLLIPTYGAVWASGRWYAAHHTPTSATLPLLAGAALLGGITAEVISSGGFYVFSGYFDTFSGGELLNRFAEYMPATLWQLLAYVGIGALVHLSLSRVADSHQQRL